MEEDILKGTVINVIDGDRFDLEVTDVVSDNSDQYDGVERIRVTALSDDMSSRTDALEEYAEPDNDQVTSNKEDRDIDTGRVDSTRFYEVRSKEDLELRAKGMTVECMVRERNSQGEIEAKVTVL